MEKKTKNTKKKITKTHQVKIYQLTLINFVYLKKQKKTNKTKQKVNKDSTKNNNKM